jgi:uncharacterized protein (DUF952 family)
MLIYHITHRSAWEQALAAGQYTHASLASEGFIHASSLAQIPGTAERYYHGQPDLILLEIDPARSISEVRFDPVVLEGLHTEYPHIYGPLNLDAVVSVMEFPAGPDGVHVLPERLKY